MAWSTPPTVVTGDVITAAWGNTIRDLLRYLKGLDGAVAIDAALSATSFTGSVNASNINAGTLPGARLTGVGNSNLTNDSGFITATTEKVADGGLYAYDQSILNDQAVQLVDTGNYSLVHISLSVNHQALVWAVGTPVIISDKYNTFSVTQDTANKINVYFVIGSPSRIDIQNKTGVTVNLRITRIGGVN